MRKTVIFLIAMRKMTLVKLFENFFLIFQWFIQKIENLQFNIFSPYKMGQNTCKNFQNLNFQGISGNWGIHNGLLFSNNQSYWSPHFENFLKIQFLKIVLTHFVWEKIDLRFSIFWMNQKILSIFQKILNFFWKNPFLKIFTSVSTHFAWGKILNFRFSIFWMNHWKKNDVWKKFFPRLKEKLFMTSHKFLRLREKLFMTSHKFLRLREKLFMTSHKLFFPGRGKNVSDVRIYD